GNGARIRPGFDLRGDGGYVVAPPSVHPSGVPYTWLTAPSDLPLAPLPDNIRELLNGRHQAPSRDRGLVTDTIPLGARNDRLYRLGRKLRASGVSLSGITAALIEENAARCVPPLTEHEAREIARHVAEQPDRADYRTANVTTPEPTPVIVRLSDVQAEPV